MCGPFTAEQTPGTAPEKLFRLEAVQAATSRLGAPVKPFGLSTWAVTGFLVALAIVIACLLLLGRYARKETVTGIVQPASGATRVATLTPGTIAEVYVTDGQLVGAGDPILRISADPSLPMDGSETATLSSLVHPQTQNEIEAMAEQAEARTAADSRNLDDLQARRQGLMSDKSWLAASIELQARRVDLAQETVDAARVLLDRGLFSALQLRQREDALITATQGLESLRRDRSQNEVAIRQIAVEEDRLNAQLRETRAQIRVERARFEQRHAEQIATEGAVVVATSAGRVTALQGQVGSNVQPGKVLAMVIPQGASFKAELWVPSRAAGFIREGDAVRLMYDAFPYQKFGVGRGTVDRIEGAPVEPADLNVAVNTDEALYRVVVTIADPAMDGYGRRWALTPGMRLSADLILDERPLWEWLLDPIIAARKRAN